MRGTDPLDFAVLPTQLRHADGVYDVVRLANGYPIDRYCHCINPEAVAEQLERFPEGQFVAVTYENGAEKVIGMATTMITGRSPHDAALPWYDEIGSFGLRNHDPDGEWLYGVEIAVDPAYQRHGVASALYRARLALIDEFDLKGWYAGGMLMGYHRFREVMSSAEYAERVIAGELRDPTVSMQLHRGLQPRAVIENYYPEWKAGHAAVLLVFETGHSEQPRRGPSTRTPPQGREAGQPLSLREGSTTRAATGGRQARLDHRR
ncbi:MAG TPA: GNAT family N-acetyltransferase [Trueperaceae bacterium]|nr:GNAT family N-acetyltransferase [Trueperaceae bacterium]